jgi:DNA modification methylase
MATAFEDSGFQIRDQIMWVFASGFPKSHNISKSLIKLADEKERTEQNIQHNLRCMPNSDIQETKSIVEEQSEMLLGRLSEQDLSSSEYPTNNVWGQEPILEGGNNLQETEGQLQGSKIHQMSERIYGDGEERWIHNGTSVSDGTTSQQITNENGGSPSYRPQSSKQSNRKSNAISEQLTSQEIREIAQRYNNFGSALKPAHEPIVMARKPLSEKSIAENVLKHGTGGINIDGSRIEMKDKENINFERPRVREKKDWVYDLGIKWEDPNIKEYNESGRFPANIIFDEEAGQLLDEQSGKSKTKANKNYKHSKTDTESNTFTGRGTYTPREDEGGASRFFYCPKAAKKDRNEGLVVEQEKNKRPVGVAFNTEDDLFQQGNGNNHPTVKPTDLMRYLINLVTPPNGTILDPFMGSGSTGKAAVRCGVNFIGIEKEQEYMDIASARIEHERNKPTQQKLF